MRTNQVLFSHTKLDFFFKNDSIRDDKQAGCLASRLGYLSGLAGWSGFSPGDRDPFSQVCCLWVPGLLLRHSIPIVLLPFFVSLFIMIHNCPRPKKRNAGDKRSSPSLSSLLLAGCCFLSHSFYKRKKIYNRVWKPFKNFIRTWRSDQVSNNVTDFVKTTQPWRLSLYLSVQDDSRSWGIISSLLKKNTCGCHYNYINFHHAIIEMRVVYSVLILRAGLT